MYYYSLRIDVRCDTQISQINEILGIVSNGDSGFWELEVIRELDDQSFNFIDFFLSLLNGKYIEMENIGIYKEDISIWMLYEYEGQCNMEFRPIDMEELGKQGIILCISCWEKE